MKDEDDETAEFVEKMMRDVMKKPEIVAETVAKAIREAEHAEGHCDDSDTYVSYLPAARAALAAYHDYIRRHS